MIDQEIQARMNAFRGNPQGLMQRYAQDQQLIDLLALQKLKSEKEAAARQMQMQMGQGQMPTVAQQREQELMGMAKKEVTDRVGQVAQQQAKQQQENLQRVAQAGIAQAPAPNMMPAQAMASGGIVAFAGGGDLVQREPEWIRNAPEWLKAAWRAADAKGDVRALQAIKQRAAQLAQSPVAAPVRPAAPAASAAPAAPAAPELPAAPAGGVPPEAPPPAATQMQGGLPPPGATGAGNIALPARPGAGAMPAGAPQAQGIAQAAPAGAQPPAQAQPDALGLEKYLRGQMATDPAAAQAAARAEYEKDYAPLMQEQRGLQQEGIAQLRERMAQQQARQDPLLAWMAGARGRTIGEVLGNAGRAGMEYQNQQAAAQAALQDQLQKLRETEMTGRIGQVTQAREAGETRRKEAMETAGKAATVAGAYSVGMENAENRAMLAEARAQQIADKALLAKSLTPDQLRKAREAAATLVANKLKTIEGFAIKDKIDKGLITQKQLEDEQFFRLIAEAAPEVATAMAAQQPAASNIPAPPPGAVRPKGAK